MTRLLLGVLMILISTLPSDAALVVATCGSPSQTYTVGTVRQITVDTNGKICT